MTVATACTRPRTLAAVSLLVCGGAVAGSAVPLGALQAGQHEGHAAAHPAPDSAPSWRMPPVPMDMSMMLPGLMGSVPNVEPFLPGAEIDPMSLTGAVFREVVHLEDGDTLRLEAGFVRRTIGSRRFTMYGYNGQYPGPLLRVPQGATIVVRFENAIDLPSTVHWHGVRLDNRFDGVPGVTQEPVEPGEAFTYEVHFRDAGIYWYHPHVREDIQQDLGLYGNLIVESPDPAYLPPVNGEEVLLLDDLAIDGGGLFPYGKEGAVQALMGRFGNVLLVNGAPDYELEARRGEVRRFYLTNVASTRVLNLVFTGASVKLLATDVGRFEREEFVESVVIAPAQRYVVDVLFEEPGVHAIVNSIQAIDHFMGTFEARVDTLGLVTVRDRPAAEDHRPRFEEARANEEVIAELDPLRRRFGGPPDHELELTMRTGDLPSQMVAVMALDTLYFPPVEWNDVMPMMNYLSTSRNVSWVMRDAETGLENMEIQWEFEVGDVVKIRIHNERRSFHPMQHPIHLHGQRFLVVARDGVPNGNLAWKDTVVIPVGATFDLLLEVSNPGRWMAHCHIAEHLDAGMMMVFGVDRAAP